ncbi:hypothetical protein [Dietzia sp.]|uniref:hypothetical protein n=1 Tax=Dietzia sp. TaxID=1871616 RepID=UPI002FDB5DD9
MEEGENRRTFGVRAPRVVRAVAFAVGLLCVLGATFVVATISDVQPFAEYFPESEISSARKVLVGRMSEQRWMVVFALGISALVAVAVLPRRRKHGVHGFPWFWIAFPITALAFAASVAVWWPEFPSIYGHGYRYVPLGRTEYSVPGMDYLSDDQKVKLTLGMIAMPVMAVMGAGASVWAWRSERY